MKTTKGRPQKLFTGLRYILMTTANYALPVRVIGQIHAKNGNYVLLKVTR